MAETFTSATNEPDDDAPFRARLSFDLDVDIGVVGAGLAGLTVALEAARLGASVAVLEGRHVGWNASGNQLGTVMPGFSLPIGDLIERVGLEDARALWALSKEGADYVRAAATEEAMPGIARTEGALEVSNVDAGETLISRLQTLSEDFETEVEGWQVDRVRDQLRTGRYFHGIYQFRIVDGDRLMWASPETTWDARPRRFGPAIQRRIATVFPTLGKVAISDVFGGAVGVTVHGMPQIGQLRKGLWVASGFGRQGLNTSAMAGLLVARSILWGDERWRLFSPFELVWAGGPTGRVAGYFIGMWGRASSAAAGALARHRERVRAQERIREARLAEANRQAGTRAPQRPSQPGRPRQVRPPPASAPANSEEGDKGR